MLLAIGTFCLLSYRTVGLRFDGNLCPYLLSPTVPTPRTRCLGKSDARFKRPFESRPADSVRRERYLQLASQRRRSDRRPLRCFLCDEECHVAYRCPARTLLQSMLRQQAQEPVRESPRGQILTRSPKPKVAQIGCTVGPPFQANLQ